MWKDLGEGASAAERDLEAILAAGPLWRGLSLRYTPVSGGISNANWRVSTGTGFTRPNPLVGCVITHEGRIIGEGWHQQYGGPHAEVNAIAAADIVARGGLSGADYRSRCPSWRAVWSR